MVGVATDEVRNKEAVYAQEEKMKSRGSLIVFGFNIRPPSVNIFSFDALDNNNFDFKQL